MATLHLGPPIPDPQKIICIGLNYHDHAKEVGATPPPSPIIFAKFANSLVGPTDDLIPLRDENHVDYEAELAVVIGKAGRYISRENALAHAAGAMAFNDVSAGTSSWPTSFGPLAGPWTRSAPAGLRW